MNRKEKYQLLRKYGFTPKQAKKMRDWAEWRIWAEISKREEKKAEVVPEQLLNFIKTTVKKPKKPIPAHSPVNIFIHVRNRKGQPIPNAVIDIDGEKIKTNENGEAIFPKAIPKTRYKIEIRRRGYAKKKMSVWVGDEDKRLEVWLGKKRKKRVKGSS